MVATHHETAVELPHGFSDQPVPDWDFRLESESLPDDYTEGEALDGDIDLDVDMAEEPRGLSSPLASRTLGQQLHKVALKAASRLGLPLPAPPSAESSLLDGQYYSRICWWFCVHLQGLLLSLVE